MEQTHLVINTPIISLLMSPIIFPSKGINLSREQIGTCCVKHIVVEWFLADRGYYQLMSSGSLHDLMVVAAELGQAGLRALLNSL